jgi:hypothetical protein
LTHFTDRTELAHIGLDIEHGRPVVGIQAAHANGSSIDGNDRTPRYTDSIRPSRAALCEDSDLRPCRIVARTARRSLDFIFGDAVEEKNNLEVRECIEPGERLG